MTDEGVDLAERERPRRAAVEIPPEEAIGRDAEVERGGGGVLDDGRPMFLGEGQTETRKPYLTELTRVPLLIIDDLGMRKLPQTAAQDLLELIMRRYERASTMLTSNRPVDDWGKRLGDTAAVTALLGSVAPSRARAQVRPAQLAHKGDDGLAVGGRPDVKLDSCLGTPKWPGLRCPQMAGFKVSTEDHLETFLAQAAHARDGEPVPRFVERSSATSSAVVTPPAASLRGLRDRPADPVLVQAKNRVSQLCRPAEPTSTWRST